MSIVTLKKKVKTQYDNMSVNSKNGFSINGTRRNQGYVGQTMLSRSLPRTLCNGNVPRGHGGCCGTFPVKHIIQSGVNYLNDPNIIKSSVMNTKGMIETNYNCVPPTVCPHVDNSLGNTDNVLKTFTGNINCTIGVQNSYSNTIGISNNATNIYLTAFDTTIYGLGEFLYVSKNNGNTFNKITNISTSPNNIKTGITNISCDETGKYVYFSHNENIFYYSNDSLQTINKIDITYKIISISCSTTGQYVVYNNIDTIFKSDDYGSTFTIIGSPSSDNIKTVSISPDGSLIIITTTNTTNTIYLYYNSNFYDIPNPPSTNTNFGNISITNDNMILLTTYIDKNNTNIKGNVFISDTDGIWRTITSCPPGNYYNSSMSNDGNVLAVCDNFSHKIYYSINKGIDWYYLSDFNKYTDTNNRQQDYCIPFGVSRDGKYICIGNGVNIDKLGNQTTNNVFIYLLGTKQENNLMVFKGKYPINIVKPDSNRHLNDQQHYIEKLANKANSCPQLKNKYLEKKCITGCPLYFKTNYLHTWKTIIPDSTKMLFKTQNDYITTVKSITCIRNDMENVVKNNKNTPFACSNVK